MLCTPPETRAIVLILMLLDFQQEESLSLNAHCFYEFVFCLGPQMLAQIPRTFGNTVCLHQIRLHFSKRPIKNHGGLKTWLSVNSVQDSPSQMVSRNLDIVLQKGRYSVDCFKIRNENGNILFTSP